MAVCEKPAGTGANYLVFGETNKQTNKQMDGETDLRVWISNNGQIPE